MRPLAQSQGVVGARLKPKARNLDVLSPVRGLRAKARTTGAPFGRAIRVVTLELCATASDGDSKPGMRVEAALQASECDSAAATRRSLLCTTRKLGGILEA